MICGIMDVEDDNDAAWDHQQQLEREMLEDDPGYAEWLLSVAAINYSIQLGD